jgi:hypothetical protein
MDPRAAEILILGNNHQFVLSMMELNPEIYTVLKAKFQIDHNIIKLCFKKLSRTILEALPKCILIEYIEYIIAALPDDCEEYMKYILKKTTK